MQYQNTKRTYQNCFEYASRKSVFHLIQIAIGQTVSRYNNGESNNISEWDIIEKYSEHNKYRWNIMKLFEHDAKDISFLILFIIYD